MGGTVILTGANSSLAIPAVEHILTAFPAYHLLLTVRDASSADSNTEKLRETISRHPGTKATIIQVDFAELAAVRNFVKNVTEGVASGRYPRLSAIICNAHYWDLIGEAQLTADGYEKTLQICHIAHAALVLPLLGQFGPESGRVVLLSSLAHWAGKSQMEKYPPGLPEDLNTLARPVPDPDYYGRGFQRYGNAKLAIVTWMHALNRRLEEDASLRHISVVAINPGLLVDSRGLRTRTPQSTVYMQWLMFQPFLPVFRFMDHTMRTSAEAGHDVAEIALSPKYANQRGSYLLLERADCAPESQDKEKQDRLWVKTADWAGLGPGDSPLGSTF